MEKEDFHRFFMTIRGLQHLCGPAPVLQDPKPSERKESGNPGCFCIGRPRRDPEQIKSDLATVGFNSFARMVRQDLVPILWQARSLRTLEDDAMTAALHRANVAGEPEPERAHLDDDFWSDSDHE